MKINESSKVYIEFASKLDDAFKAVTEAVGERIAQLPVEHFQAFGSSYTKVAAFFYQTAEAVCLTHAIWKRPKERMMRVFNLAMLSSSMAGDIAECTVALGELKVVAAKVSSVAASAGIGIGFVTTTGGIIVDSVRLGQTIRELKNMDAVELKEGGRISFKALYGTNRKKLAEVEESLATEDKTKVREHMKTRLKVSIGFRSAAILAGVITLVALTILFVAGGPLGWGFIAAATAISLATVAAKLIVNYRLDKKLEALKPQVNEAVPFGPEERPVEYGPEEKPLYYGPALESRFMEDWIDPQPIA